MTNVAICSISSLLSEGLKAILSSEFHVQGLFTSPEQLVAQQAAIRTLNLLVIEMSPLISFETLRTLGTAAPDSHIILWVDTISAEFVSRCLSLGIRGVLAKSASTETHLRCLREVANGGLWIDQALSHSLQGSREVHLTPREQQIVGLIVQGLSNKELAWSLGITEGTVKVYLSRLFPKIGVTDRFELALVALKNLPVASEQSAGAARHAGEPAIPLAFPDTIRISADFRGKAFPFAARPTVPAFDFAIPSCRSSVPV